MLCNDYGKTSKLKSHFVSNSQPLCYYNVTGQAVYTNGLWLRIYSVDIFLLVLNNFDQWQHCNTALCVTLSYRYSTYS